VTLDAVIEEYSLPVLTSAQNAELIAFTWVLQFSAGVHVNIYMYSKHAFATSHVHGAYIKKGAH
jgi:hypothetical protein